MRILFLIVLFLFFGMNLNSQAETRRVTVIYDEKPTTVSATVNEVADLWVTLADLKRATRFVVKPQGICRDELCFPIPKNRKTQFTSRQKGVTWFNLSEFARLVKQPTARDEKNAIYYFGPRADAQNGFLNSLEAPDFRLPDVNGKMHSLSDFRGKKVLLVTWASW
jgi:hypothetical protein